MLECIWACCNVPTVQIVSNCIGKDSNSLKKTNKVYVILGPKLHTKISENFYNLLYWESLSCNSRAQVQKENADGTAADNNSFTCARMWTEAEEQ